ncbi:16190_t:CDS:2, partial [Racocetra persica]
KERVVRVSDLDDDDEKEKVENKFKEEELEKQLYVILEFNDKRGNDEIMIEKEKDIEQSNKEIVFYSRGPAADLISTQEEDNWIISDLFDYYYEKGSRAIVDYKIEDLKKNQNKQI